MRLLSKISLLAVMMRLLAACSCPTLYCPTPVNASDQAKQWFEAQEPLPEYMRQYLKDIGDEQEAIKKNC